MPKNILILVSVVFGVGFILVLMNGTSNENSTQSSGTNAVTQRGNEQYIRIMARGGYTPNQITAKANKDTVLEIETKGTYDCSSAIAIPSLDYRNNLPPTGVTSVEIPANIAKNSIEILCSMGMYRATINFES